MVRKVLEREIGFGSNGIGSLLVWLPLFGLLAD